MNIQVIAEHSVAVDLLTGGVCIDAGCRGFGFSIGMRDLGCKVVAFDMEDFVVPEGILFFRQAISTYSGNGFYKNTEDAQAKHLHDSGLQVSIIGLNDFYDQMNFGVVDVLKLDIESTEMYLLSDPNFRPIPKQISVEFHLHCHEQLHKQYYQACMDNLSKYYIAVKHELTEAHGAGYNFWDSLFIRRDLIKHL